MAKEKEKTIRMIEKRVYTEAELKDFHNKIQKFYEEDSLTNGEIIRVLNRKKLLQAFGAIGPTGGIILTNIVRNKYGSIESYDKPTRQETFDNLWDQYIWWKGGLDWKKEMYNKKQEEHYEKLALETDENMLTADTLF